MARPLYLKHSLIFVAVTCLVATPAFADEEPVGVKAGPVVFHPGAFLETSYDSNLFYESPSELQGRDLTSVFSLRPGVQVRAATPNPILANWTALLRASYQQHVSDTVRVENGSGPEASLETSLHVWPGRTFAMTPHLLYARTKGPAGLYDQRDYDQQTIYPGVNVELAPEGGTIFSQQAAWDLRVRLYDDFEDINSLNHRFLLTTRWNFLPQTALTLLVEQHVSGYLQPTRAVSDAPYTLDNNGSIPFRAQFGLSGLLLSRLNVSLLAGYGYTFYDAGPNEQLMLARADLGYDWKQGTKLSIGYARNFEDSTFGNYFVYHRVHAIFQTLIDGRVEGALTGRLNFLDFATVQTSSGGFERNDVVYDVVTTIGYRVMPGLKVSADYAVRGNATNFAVELSPTLTASGDYIKHQLDLKLEYEY